MFLAAKILIVCFAAGSRRWNNKNDKAAAAAPRPKLITYEVCLSPACIADGAEKTMKKLQALAPPNFVIKEGTCGSYCGSGPVVYNPSSDGKKKVVTYRRVSGSKILDLLAPEGVAPELLEGYELVLEADELFAHKEYAKAVELYEKAVNVAFRSAVDLQVARDRIQPPKQPYPMRKTIAPVGLEWLVRARRNVATSKLELGDIDAAMLAAQASCNLSRNTSAESFLVLAQVYHRKGHKEGELQALKTMFALPVDESKLPFPVQIQRREAGFRLDRLERETSSRGK